LKYINIEYVDSFLQSMNKKTRLNKVIKLLSMYRDALDFFIEDELKNDEMALIEKGVENQGNDKLMNTKKQKKKKNKKKINKNKKKYAMNLDTSFFVVFNVLDNIDVMFYNIMNEGNLKMRVLDIEKIKSNEIFIEEEKGSKKKNKTNDNKNNDDDNNKNNDDNNNLNENHHNNMEDTYDLNNMVNYKHIKKYKPLIIYFFNNLAENMKKIKNNDIYRGILKILKKKEILRWVVILNYGKIFLKKICKLFVVSTNSDIYFFLYILIENIFQLYNERKKIIFMNLCNIKKDKEEEEDIKKTYNMERIIYQIYQNFFQSYILHYGLYYNDILHINHRNFKENCLLELFTYLSHDVAYTIVFRYMQIIIQKIREQYNKTYTSEKKNKKKYIHENNNNNKKNKKEKKYLNDDDNNNNNKCKGILHLNNFHIHSSYMMLLIKLLSKIIKVYDNLHSLIYGVTLLIISILKTKINNMKYIPINLQLITILIRTMEDQKKYIPLFSYISSIINGLKSYKHIRTITKNQNIRNEIENFDINTSLEINENLLCDFQISHQVYDKIYVVLYDYLGLMVCHISFPEFFVAIESYFKKYYVECQIQTFKNKLKNLLTHAKNSIQIIINKRKNVNIYNIYDQFMFFQKDNLPLYTQRQIVLENYENSYLNKIKAKLSGLQHIKNKNNESDNEQNTNHNNKQKKNFKKKDRKRKAQKENLKDHTQANHHINKKKKNINENINKSKNKNINHSTELPTEDNVQDFSMSSDEE
ncbi:putative nucleolar complex protein 2, partial [Plasmodium gaboni]